MFGPADDAAFARTYARQLGVSQTSRQSVGPLATHQRLQHKHYRDHNIFY